MKKSLILILWCYCSYSYAANNCEKGSELQLIRSKELRALANADQKDRENWQNMTSSEMTKLSINDLNRRKRVGEIFAEGCFQVPVDYLAAALIYQHGDTPDHYYQAFVWSKRAAELGERSGQSFSALAIDRYLISIGKKQLFGSQYQKLSQDKCFCMQPVEKSFPDKYREEYSGRTLEKNYQMMASLNDANCPRKECQNNLKPTLKGSIIGLW